MGFRDWFRPKSDKDSSPKAFVLNSPEFYEYVRNNGEYGVGDALKNPSVIRAVDLISSGLAALPCDIVRRGGARSVEDTHPLYELLMFRPNDWQTGFEFRQLMQAWTLIHGNAYARIVRTGRRVSALLPMDPARVLVEQMPDFSLRYTVSSGDGRQSFNVAPSDIFHIRGFSMDGVKGISRVKQAADVIRMSVDAQHAAAMLFQNGVIGGMALHHPQKIGPEAAANLKSSVNAYNAGAKNAGRTMILEEGMTRSFAPVNSQTLEMGKMRADLVEEFARLFGVPRPLMMVDDTSWGTGVEQLAIQFVRFTLRPWFVAWEQAIERALMQAGDRRLFRVDFDERELLRGTMSEQAEFFSKALGSGGHKPWMEANEVRELSGLAPHADGSGLVAAGEMKNDTSQPAR
jgi:HK97 family phage portal protein